jgi:hypothetical protein
MHEATRTFCCRAGFVLGCLLPTLLVGGWIVVRRSPVYAQAQQAQWQSQLGRTLGLSAQVELIEEPRPGRYVLYGVTLCDPDAPKHSPPLAKAKRLELGRGPGGLVIVASEGEIASEHLPRLWAILHERLVRGPEIARMPVLLSLSSLTLSAPADRAEQSLKLSDLRGQLISNATAAKAVVEFRPAGEFGEPARLSVERDRTKHPVATKWSLSTGATPLPCSALAPCIPSLSNLGPNCTFHGYVVMEVRDHQWHAATGGTFANLDLTTLVSQRLGHSLSGTANVAINQALWRDGKLATASGQLRASNGVISRRLWEDAAKELSLQITEPLARFTDSHVRYHELAVGFELKERVLRLAGQCANQPQDTILADEYGPLVMGSSARPIEPIALVRALVPASDGSVPAVQEAQQLIYWLPLPTQRR